MSTCRPSLCAALLAWLVLASTAQAAAPRADSFEARLALRECSASVREQAVAACRQALELGLGPERGAIAQRLLGRSLADLTRWDEALEAYREALRLQPADADAAHGVGLALLYGLNRAADAEPYLRQALADRPDEAVFHLQLAIALNAIGHHEEALGEFKAALALDVTVLDQRPAAQAAYLASLREALWP